MLKEEKDRQYIISSLTDSQYLLDKRTGKYKHMGLHRSDEFSVEVAKWMWYPYVPMGKITIMQGDPGEGKTTLSLALAAQMAMPAEERLFGNKQDEEFRQPFDILYLTAEDGFSDTILPRYINSGGDPERLFTLVETEQCPDTITLTDERIWTYWAKYIAMSGAGKLIIFDPLQAFLGDDVDMHRANEIRPVMKKLAALAEESGAAVILIGHQNKQQGGKAIYRGLGSIDIAAAARSVIEVSRHPQEKNRRIIRHVKSSLAERAEPTSFEILPDGGIGVPRVFQEAETKKRQSQIDKAVQRLYALLEGGTGHSKAMKTSVLETVLATEGIGRDAFKKARSVLKCKAFKKDGVYWVQLPETPPPPPEPAGDFNISGVTQEREL